MGGGVRAVLDTNILIDYLNGLEAAKRETAQYDSACISIITWMEVLAGARNDSELTVLRRFLLGFEVVELTREIALQAVQTRRSRRIRLPDAIIWATAQTLGYLLVTRNTRDFPANSPAVRVPYTV